MPTEEEINKRLGLLYRICGLAAPLQELEKLISEGNLSMAQTQINKKFETISSLISGQQMGSKSELWDYVDSGRILLAEEYVLPLELEDIHPKILKDITFKKSTRDMAFGGVLVYGKTPGTGKTEEFYFLASCAIDKAIFVVANLDKISGSETPATVLKQLYKELDAMATKENKNVVLLMDEFERIVNMHAEKSSSSRKERKDSSSEKNHNSTSVEEHHETIKLDDVGKETFATLKTLISGGENINRVFTFATSNQEAYDSALERRLKPVLLKSFDFPTYEIERFRIAPEYALYAKHIPRIIDVLQATQFRENKTTNAHLSKIREEVCQVMKDFKPGMATFDSVISSGRDSKKYVVLVKNNQYLKTVLNYFGFDVVKFFSDKKNSNRIEFSSLFEEHYLERGDIRKLYGGFSDEPSEEITMMQTLTPDKIAKWYKENPSVFKRYDSAKKYLGRKIFPQLALVK